MPGAMISFQCWPIHDLILILIRDYEDDSTYAFLQMSKEKR